jgi:hypothetical protein
VTTWAAGYSQSELDAAQQRFGLRFPPDLVALLRERRPAGGYEWRTDIQEIRRALAWPRDGLIFDVEHNDLWLSTWGSRPAEASDRAAIVTEAVACAPRLIPVYSHRYIPETPHEAGNPVFSVYQSDIIVYGETLEQYLSNEFGSGRFVGAERTKYIPFWSDLAGRAD